MTQRMRKDYECYIDGYSTIRVYMAKSFYDGLSASFHLKDETGAVNELTIKKKEDFGGYFVYHTEPARPIEIGRDYLLYDEHCQTTPACYSHIVKSAKFAQDFSCPDQKLGIDYTLERTVFALWSPVAVQAQVILHEKDGERVINMERKERGVWQAQIDEDLLKMPYTYRVRVNGTWRDAADPYNPFTGINTSASFVDSIDRLKMPEKVALEPMKEQTDAIIYEASVRDLTSQEGIGIEHPSTFEGLCEENETTRSKQTGLSYLKTLGFTHLQLMPVLDFGSVDEQYPALYYNWGYDPMHFRALEGSYSLHPADPRSRIEEFAALVHKLHENGIRVTLDLVFNHVWKKELFDLEKLVPDYYFLMDAYGNYSNGSFCGNDIDSRPEMSRRYLLESAMNLIDLYDIDGFRFDLMGVLDINIMNDIAAGAKAKKPDFMVYGEGWDMPSFVPSDIRASQNNQRKMPLVGHFSDRFREIIRGDNHHLERPGFSGGNTSLMDEARQVVCASVLENRYDAPFKAVNYVECHDNNTMWDKNRSVCFDKSREFRMQRQNLTNAMVLLSQGVPFLHSGQEFGRTKQNLANTYNCPDRFNRIDYHRRDEFASMVEETRKLIALRKAHPAFRLTSTEAIRQHVSTDTISNKVLIYRVSDGHEHLIVFFNPTEESFSYTLERPASVLYGAPSVNGQRVQTVSIAPVSTTVLSLD